MRVGAPIIVAVMLGILVPASGSADRAAPQPAVLEAQEPVPDATAVYLRLTRHALQLRDERRSAELALAVARRSLLRAERRLGARLRALYVLGRPDPLEVVLGARSLDHAIVSLDGLQRIGQEDAEQVQQLRRARSRLGAVVRRLRAQEQQAAALRAHAEAVLRELAARKVPSRPPPIAAGPQAAADETERGRRSLTVVALGYSIAGTTATGLPAGVGTVAVDPSVIPLGTALTIPGYGSGVAADTGGRIRGTTIDLWFPTAAEAHAWGRRVVTIEVRSG